MKKIITLLITHGMAIGIGFAAGIFALPILIAPAPPEQAELVANAENSQFTGTFDRNRTDSDFLHWGEGEVSISRSSVTLMGELAPGPDYKLYFSPEFVETESAFNDLKSQMIQVGSVNTFTDFMVPIAGNIDPAEYSTVIVWCETFGEFITSAQYQ